jgi:mitotic spindle assembly checkpoint protein MAD1
MTGAESTARPPSRGTYRQSTRVSSGEFRGDKSAIESEEDKEKRRRELEELKAEIKTLKYTIDNHKQEEELAKLRHESEVREVRRKAEDDFKKMQGAEAEKSKAVRQHEALLKEITEIRDSATNEKAALERRVREVEESKRVLEEEVEDTKAEREETVRVIERRTTELETRNETLQRTVEELQQDSDRREALFQEAQQQVADKDTAYGTLEAEVLRLKAQTGDADTLGVIKRELSEQVSHIRTLEATNREQAAELKHFKRLHKSIEVVEEEKRSLQRKLDAMEGLEAELGEARIQRQRLEDERLTWTAYLQSQADSDGQIEFDSPEALARALIEERLQSATLLERLGSLEPELSEKDSIIQGLEREKSKLVEQIEKLKATGGGSGNSKAQLRLERQRALAIKEAEYLRAQLKTYDTEDTTFNADIADEAKLRRIQELEDMVDQYRQEVQTLHGELASREPAPATETISTKRARDEAEDNERLGELSRKNRKLQDDLSTLQTSTKLLQKELSVAQERLTTATQHSKTRILSLRSNPTSDIEVIKMSTLTALRNENADLLLQLQSGKRSTSAPSVPVSALEASQRDVKEAQDLLISEKKRNDRLKKVWLAKSQEFRELVISLLGWDVMFMKDGKMRVTSSFYPSRDDDENSILFDGERGTMKVSGGPESKFAMKIMDQISFWVRDRGSIPCLLAALTLEFYEEANKDKTLRIGG